MSVSVQAIARRTPARRGITWTSLLVVILAGAHLAQAQTPPVATQAYPVRPVTIVVPFAAGGGNDILARLLAQHMGAALGQQFVIENRAGAGGTIGARAVAKSRPDGYTLMVGHSGVFGIAPSLYAHAGYDPRRDFAPIGLIASFQQVLVVHPSVPVHTIADLIAQARREPGHITYESAGVGSGSHLSTELFATMTAIRLAHVPYRGTGAELGDLVGGHLAMAITTFPSVIGQVRGGLLRAVAVTGAARSPILRPTCRPWRSLGGRSTAGRHGERAAWRSEMTVEDVLAIHGRVSLSRMELRQAGRAAVRLWVRRNSRRPTLAWKSPSGARWCASSDCERNEEALLCCGSGGRG
jgi:tripartite-type tricarboxylate transporter receptor subunit TctC